MKYLLLAYDDAGMLGAMPPGERAALAEACATNDQALRQSGRLLVAERLQGCATEATVCVQGGAVALHDGPCAAADAQLAELFVIDARDLNEAIQIAAQMPQNRGGPIEIRPVSA